MKNYYEGEKCDTDYNILGLWTVSKLFGRLLSDSYCIDCVLCCRLFIVCNCDLGYCSKESKGKESSSAEFAHRT